MFEKRGFRESRIREDSCSLGMIHRNERCARLSLDVPSLETRGVTLDLLGRAEHLTLAVLLDDPGEHHRDSTVLDIRWFEARLLGSEVEHGARVPSRMATIVDWRSSLALLECQRDVELVLLLEHSRGPEARPNHYIAFHGEQARGISLRYTPAVHFDRNDTSTIEIDRRSNIQRRYFDWVLSGASSGQDRHPERTGEGTDGSTHDGAASESGSIPGVV